MGKQFKIGTRVTVHGKPGTVSYVGLHSFDVELDGTGEVIKSLKAQDIELLPRGSDPYLRWKEHPKTSEDFYKLGRFQKGYGDLAAALNSFDRSISMVETPGAYTERALTKAILGDMKGAMADVNDALELDPEFALAYTVFGLALERQGDYEQASWFHTKALQIDPLMNFALVHRGKLRFEMGDYSGCIEDLESYVHSFPPSLWPEEVLTMLDVARRHVKMAKEMDSSRDIIPF